jgi:hypothetical protein
MGPCESNCPRLRETNEETSNADRALSFKLYGCEFAHFSVTIKPRARGKHIKMFIGERRTKKTPIWSRLLGLLIVDRVSRKPQEKPSRDRARVQFARAPRPNSEGRCIPRCSSHLCRRLQASTGNTFGKTRRPEAQRGLNTLQFERPCAGVADLIGQLLGHSGASPHHFWIR